MALLYGSKRILERSNHLKYTCNLYSQHQYVLRTWNVQEKLPTILVSASYELRSPGHFVQLHCTWKYFQYCKRFVSCTENLVPGTVCLHICPESFSVLLSQFGGTELIELWEAETERETSRETENENDAEGSYLQINWKCTFELTKQRLLHRVRRDLIEQTRWILSFPAEEEVSWTRSTNLSQIQLLQYCLRPEIEGRVRP